MTDTVVKLNTPSNPFGLDPAKLTSATKAFKPVSGRDARANYLPRYLLTEAELPKTSTTLSPQRSAMVQLLNFVSAAPKVMQGLGEPVQLSIPKRQGITHAGHGDRMWEPTTPGTFKAGSNLGHGHT